MLYIKDAFPYDATETTDNDQDEIGDNTDDDNDGILDIYDPYPFGNVSVDEVGNLYGIKVIPNPADERIQIFGLKSGVTVSLKIIDSKGAVVYLNNAYIEGIDINISTLNDAFYSVIITENANVNTILLIKK